MNTEITKKIRSSFKSFFTLFFSKFSIWQKIVFVSSFACWGVTLGLFFESENPIGLLTLWYGIQVVVMFALIVNCTRYFMIQVANEIYNKKIIKWTKAAYDEIEWEEFVKEMRLLKIISKNELLSAKEYFEIKGRRRIEVFKWYVSIFTGVVSFILASIKIFEGKLSLEEVTLLYKFGLMFIVVFFFFLAITYKLVRDVLNRESEISEKVSMLLTKYIERRKFKEA